MNTETVNTEVQDWDIKDFIYSFVPWGSGDIHRTIEVALEAGQNVQYAIDAVENLKDGCDIDNLEDIDPVYCVHEAILQEARNEIEEMTGFDFCNDGEHGEIYTYGNYMATSYDYPEEAVEELREKLADTDPTEYSEALKWFLNQIEY